MAKKKLNPQPKPQTHPQPTPLTTIDSSSSSDKLQTLKSLNSMLLKETSQRREEVESLKSAVSSSEMHKNLLESRLDAASDDAAASEIQKSVALVLLVAHARDMGLRFGAAVSERNEMERAAKQSASRVGILEGEVDRLATSREEERARFGAVVRERDQLKRDFDAAVERERAEVHTLRLEREKFANLSKKLTLIETAIGELAVQRDSALSESEKSARLIDELRGEMEAVTREKRETLETNQAQELKIIDLESQLNQIDESLRDLREEEAAMRAKIRDLEMSLSLAAEKEEAMAMEIGALVKQKEEIEKSVEMLKEGRDGVQKVLDVVQRELQDKQREIDETVREKDEIELMEVEREREVLQLVGEVDGLKDAVQKLKESSRDLEEKNNQLVSEVSHYRKSTEEAMLERDNIRKGFDEEEDKVKSLALQVAGMEDKIERMAAELEQMRSERENLVEKNEMMESRVGSLMSEKDALQQSLLEARRESDDLKATVEFSCNSSSQTLTLLKRTATLVSQYNDSVEEAISDEQEIEEQIQPYAEQLGAIRNAFRGKNKMVADMKKQLVLMQNSVASANKMKSLWAAISSATTILAAAIAVYVAKGH